MAARKQQSITSGPRTSSTKLSDLFSADVSRVQSEDEFEFGFGSGSDTARSSNASLGNYGSNPTSAPLSPWTPATASPFAKSPWTHVPLLSDDADTTSTGLVGSLVREEGHVYSLAASGDLLFTGSDSKNIRVWKGNREFAGFKSNSGLVKAIVVAGEKVFTGHQDGKIRIWRASSKDPSVYKRVGSLPKLRDFLKSSMNPSNYVPVRRNKNALWLRHYDAVSCLSYDDSAGILYSGSWDRTVKAWRASDATCLESLRAHDDAVNAVAAAGFGGLVFTGSADGSVKAWRRETSSGRRHVLVRVLLKEECAVTALAVAREARVLYAGCSDGTVHHWRWETAAGSPEYGGALRGHRMAVLSLSVAGGLIASGGADRMIRVWRRNDNGSHVSVAVLTGHEEPIKCLSIEEEVVDQGGARYVVYSGSLDKSVKIWRVSDFDVDRVSERWTVNGMHVTESKRSPWHVRGSDRVSDEYVRTGLGPGPLVQDVMG